MTKTGEFDPVIELVIEYNTLTCNSFLPVKGLPDEASIEAASWVEPDNDRTVIIDASTAFRVAEDWDYGFPGKK